MSVLVVRGPAARGELGFGTILLFFARTACAGFLVGAVLTWTADAWGAGAATPSVGGAALPILTVLSLVVCASASSGEGAGGATGEITVALAT